MKRALVLVLLAAMVLGLAGPSAAQQARFTIDSVEVRDHPEVAVTVTVESQLLEDATPSFTIAENGQVREVTVTAAASDDLNVVLALDVSGSMRGAPLAAAKDAAAQFIEEMPAAVEIAVVSFGDAPALVAEFTSDKATLLSAVSLLSARGETALYDGLASAAALLSNEAEEGRTIVLLSDGGDTVSAGSLDDAVATLEGLGATFFAVELQSPENDSEALLSLASAADGSVIPADDPAALEALFGQIASELLSSYRLVFTSGEFGPAALEVQVQARGVVLARSSRDVDFPADPSLAVPDPIQTPLDDTDPAVVDPVPLPSPRTGTTVELSWLETSTGSWLGAAAIFLAFATVFTIISLRPRTAQGTSKWSTLTPSSEARARKKGKTPLSLIAESATALAEQSLNRGDRFRSVNAALERAGVAFRPGEFLVLVISAALAAAAIGFLLINAVFGLLFGGIVVLLVPAWLSSKAAKRSAAFNEQLGATLQLMSSSLRAGYGLLQSVDAVAEEAPSPTAEEFQRIKVETHLGRDLDEALQAASDRVNSEDFRWIAEAIQIHRQIGGDLAEILDAVNETIRDRTRIRRRIKALSAEGRISAVVLSLIPVALAIVISIINPAYIGELPATCLGQGLIVGGIIAWVIALMWMRRIVRLVF
jgi:tight adherence protein B